MKRMKPARDAMALVVATWVAGVARRRDGLAESRLRLTSPEGYRPVGALVVVAEPPRSRSTAGY